MSSVLTYESWDDGEYNQLLYRLNDYHDVIKWSYNTYEDDEIIYACSFGAEGIVLLDLISKVNEKAHIIFLDTGLHFKETYELIEKIKKKYPTLKIELVKPELTLKQQANEYGDRLWERDASLCCHLRKIIPLQSVLKDKLAWLSGLRRDNATRKNVNFINKDDKFKMVKICPLIYWSWDDVWSYIKLNDLPYNELHDNHYPSIGCLPCTSPVNKGDDIRSGRWKNLDKTECGLHVNN